jgi:5'-deoxynucleotidase YfbR-like HD superfamily hydrolase
MSFKAPEAERKSLTTLRSQYDLVEFGGQVKRYHAKVTLTTETIGEHSYYVAWVAKLLSEGKPSANLLLACLQHDNTEYETGDMPAPSKRKMGLLEKFDQWENEILNDHCEQNFALLLTPEEKHIFEMADSISGIMYCIKERMLGNKYLNDTYTNYTQHIRKLVASRGQRTQQEVDIMEILEEKWEKAND